ncbi:trypsin-1-like isoform X4 [Portunus trituberculatus]|uniref:trypsin-1-like isoform X3 n=1 Tax=Portunus trituberculatus TaxID=210409 RepID=UPI001E1D02CE|nr:trypsin-1-like isoform X3 [Portunus trituberculatus]XP_045132696.1 trypsin-1-like isoform X4 [Portunus trituberculatus]
MNFFAVLLCVFLAGIQSSQGRTFPASLPASHTPNGVMLAGRRDGNERSKTDGNTLPVKPRIVGGTEAEKHEFPWVVEIQFYHTKLEKYKHKCGASVIDEWWVMTAAHCVDNDASFKIVAGEHILSAVEDEEQHRKVETIVTHPGWDYDTAENDIALLKLSEKLELDGKTVAPISLPTPLTKSTGECVVAGWGRISNENFTCSDVLRKVRLPIVSDEECRKSYATFNEKIFDSNICAGYKEGGKDSCNGDSGGPLVCQGENNKNYVAGVVSWGIGCGLPNFPSVYTEVSYFVDWINEVRNQESLQH